VRDCGLNAAVGKRPLVYRFGRKLETESGRLVTEKVVVAVGSNRRTEGRFVIWRCRTHDDWRERDLIVVLLVSWTIGCGLGAAEKSLTETQKLGPLYLWRRRRWLLCV